MVAGDHLDANACLLAGADRSNRLRSRWIDHALEAKQRQASAYIHVMDLICAGRQGAAGKSQHAQASRRHFVSAALHRSAVACHDLTRCIQHGGATRQNGLDGPLHIDDARLLVAQVVERCHVLML